MSLQVELLEDSFEKIKPVAEEFVNSFYENLFTMYPAAQPLFEHTNMAKQKKMLLSSLVMVVENLRVPEVLESSLKGLGARHVKYGALPEHYPLVGNALLTTFEQFLGTAWTEEVKQAWVDAYGAISTIMLDGADYSQQEIALESAPEPAVEEEVETAIESAPAQEEEQEGLKVALLESSFEKIKPSAEEFVNSFYENLFTMYPAAQPLFEHTNMAKQKKMLLSSLVMVVENLRVPEVLESSLKGLGARHVKYGALPEHYPLVGNALLTTFEQYLGSDWTDSVKQAWVDAYGAISTIMLDGADYSQQEIALESAPEPALEEEVQTALESAPAPALEEEVETALESAPVAAVEEEEGGLKVALLESSFEKIKPSAEEFVNSFYENLFTMYPAAQPLFEHTNMAKQKKMLLSSLVMVVENLRVPENLESPLKGLGARHVKYGALPEHYPLVGNALLTTFEQYLGSDWTDSVKQAWVDAYGAISTIMLDGADYSQQEIALESAPEPAVEEEVETAIESAAEPAVEEEVATAIESATEPAVEEEVATAIESAAEPAVEEEVETAIESAPVAAVEEEEGGLKVALLESSFEKIKPSAEEFVNSFYENLFTMYPAAQPLFEHTNMAKQKNMLLSSLVMVVENLRVPKNLESPLKGLGARHVKYGALPEHYPLVGNALLATFEQFLGSDWTEEVKQAWVDAYGAISTIMLDGADYSQQEVALESAPEHKKEVALESAPEHKKEVALESAPEHKIKSGGGTTTTTTKNSQSDNAFKWGVFGGALSGVGILAIILLLLL